ncbi:MULTISPECIES: helicase-exonuclease AddAB subunit AddA [Streptococcus]|uniref:helicase-exonuclease AddAB subunit AddA n=1 Tax=Streptococcus TaxID=1301 RepID=UPI0002583B44|nr:MULTISPECIES: helicase-exonuclease AddAB subunit AddA [Streptococcus]EIC77834.1 helicase-exonuclease AddAB, AddA subunit [Streptococcus oralis SK100]KZX06124.1 helicase-exonuclease AddAB subunit AddA [Streptococcus oralis]MCY7073720.1 helicase-exonuclease AddAB subunit AddA [Streptococcus oralis]OFJ66158.1 helicase-exonuclease AddAB subunit AddA [Streptococcus sp. HMSC077F03]ORO70460.1 helicase-exonuclease AddAB subunit AddA [Streptococcus oralis subsp. oralis]
MKPISFLTEEEIQKLQEAEASSNKEQKKTAEQIEAIYTAGQNILVSASAGSGKTFVMAERILDQLARGVEISQLFISTFTVKAATELKGRLEKKISQQIQETDDVDLKQHLGRQLADLPNAAIGTMDSFTQKFLGKHGYLIDIAPNFRILQNESEQLLLKNEVFHQVFEAHYQDENKENFSRLVKNFAGRGKDERGLRQQVYKIYDFLQSTSSPQKWLNESFLKGFEEADFANEKDKLTEQIKQALWNLESFFRYHLDNDAKEFPKAAYLEAMQQVLDEISSLNQESDSQAYQAVLARIVVISKEKNGRALANSSRKADLKPLADAYNDERKVQFAKLGQLADQITILDYQERYHEDTWELAKTFQTFMSDFVEAYRERKRQENAFEFADISHYTIEILENFPQVRETYQERFHEVMVDEYQDTNHIQERMLELLSNGHNRFMVGDIKQSIYRFRQADPQIFNEKFQRYAHNPQEGKLILLKENFRSSSEVLSATNDVFGRLMDQEVGEINYDSMHQLVFVNTKLTPNPENKAEFLLYDKDDSGQEEEESQTETKLTGEMRLVIKEILKLYQEKSVAFKEIALLTSSRSRNDQILLALSEYGIPVKTDGEQNNYLQSLEVQVMLDTLRVIHNPLQDYALVALMKSPMFSFDEDELARLSLQKATDKVQENLYEKLVNAHKQAASQKELIHTDLAEKLNQFMDILDSWRLYAKTHSLYDLIWKIYNDRFYYDYVGALPNGPARQANLYALALRADQFEKSNFKGLSRFIRMIDQVLEAQHDLASVAVAPPKDAVELMTIHKSKGLEFPYVFILNMDQDFNKQDSMSEVILSRQNGLGVKYIAKVETGAVEAHYPKTIKLSIPSLTYTQNEEELQLASYSEQMRLLYVAMTRAEKKLYLVGKGSREKLEAKEYPPANIGKLDSNTRLQARNFQDWIWAISKVFAKDNLNFSYRFVGEDQLTREAIGELENKSSLQDRSQADNRQSETIKEALGMLKEVEVYNTLHRAAIELPSVQTPSQIKKFYEPVMDMEGVQIANQTQSTEKKISFDLPDFSTKEKVTGAEIGSATHELMQRMDLGQQPTLASLTETLNQVQTSPAVRDKINLSKILAFFDTALGQEILANTDHLYREQPFSMLKRDQKSQEDFVVRGILDGYLLYEDRIILFDYKTDRYDQPSQLIDRYRGQLALYGEALSRAYSIENIEKYLILLGKDEVQVVKV